jgi:hypothetical protein
MTPRQISKVYTGVFLLSGALALLTLPGSVRAQGDSGRGISHPLKIKSFSVEKPTRRSPIPTILSISPTSTRLSFRSVLGLIRGKSPEWRATWCSLPAR